MVVLPNDTQLFAFGGAKMGRPVFLLATSLVAVFIASIIHYMYYYSRREKEALRMMNNEKEAKLQYLHAQINPHFLFNALNNIYSLSITNSPKTPEMLLTLTDILRYSVYQNDRKNVSVAEEAEQIEFLIKLFNLKNDDSYHVTFSKDKLLGYIEPMILVPLAENCLKHSDFAVNTKAFAKMTLVSDAKTIRFTTENTFSNAIKQDKMGGVGLANITERLNLVYPGSHSINTTTHNGIYKVELIIQWNKQ
jgi:LytS/YehU family sensor histidine kinase